MSEWVGITRKDVDSLPILPKHIVYAFVPIFNLCDQFSATRLQDGVFYFGL